MHPSSSVPACPNCDADLTAGPRYCPACGQQAGPSRLTLHAIGHDLLHALVHVDKSAWSLVRMLAVRPGIVAADYVAGRRKRYFGPFAFLVTVVALASATIALTGFQLVRSSAPSAVTDFLQHHVNLILFLQVPILAGFCRLLGWREAFNYAEYLVLAAYTKGMQILFQVVVVFPVGTLLADRPAVAQDLYYAYVPLAQLYFGWALFQFLPGRRIAAGVRGIIAGALTLATTVALTNFGYWAYDAVTGPR